MSEPEVESDNENVEVEETKPKMPVILPIDEAPKKTKRKYTITDKVKQRSAKNREMFQKLNAENRQKLKDYEKYVKGKTGLSKEEVEELLNSKFNELTSKLEELTVSSRKQEQVPEVLPTIPEEENEIYQSDGGSYYKRVNSRFAKEYETPTYTRFRRFK